MNNFFIKNDNFTKLLYSQFLSLCGGYIQNVALSAMITQKDDKYLKLGLFLFVSYLPVFLLSYFTGKLTNRISPIKILIVTEFLLLSMSVILFIFWNMSYYMLLVFGGLWGVVRAVQTPAANSMPKLLCEENNLQKNVKKLSLALSVSRAVGPIVSGVLYSAFNYRASFFANILSYIPSLILLFKIKFDFKPMRTKKSRININKPLIVLVFVLSLFGTAYNIIFSGIVKTLELSRFWFSVFMALVGTGAAFGAWIMTKRKSMLYAFFGVSISALLLALFKNLFVICPVIVAYGIFDYLFFTSAMSKIQSENDRQSVTSAMGVYTAATTGALPVGFLLLSFLSDKFGALSVPFTIAGATAIFGWAFFAKMR